ncbi:hypothetical protein WMY93_002474 [Mugilogobius chulae]|uniref:Uncharacterized protein n=1 Tax=Mugilogobius chulae TaxID=88201 RepID=A0AAW0PVK9_9GOBI
MFIVFLGACSGMLPTVGPTITLPAKSLIQEKSSFQNPYPQKVERQSSSYTQLWFSLSDEFPIPSQARSTLGTPGFIIMPPRIRRLFTDADCSNGPCAEQVAAAFIQQNKL